eukprot:TRINITY_DN107_c1_g1_i1.p1 TRINITY_DN107_c1_g1~~TRINITY_DN107_c1_g1_i1.p1  ORF type:complete len:585 (+),score=252.63 TRINITY_DN107_c1_g1_i1:1-1755(+)
MQVSILPAEREGEKENSFVLFPIVTQTTITLHGGTQFIVRRKHSDFGWLRKQLHEKFPFHIIPPIPNEIKIDIYNRISEQILERRRLSLEKFINRVVKSPHLAASTEVQNFLTSQNWIHHSWNELEDNIGNWMKKMQSDASFFVDQLIDPKHDSYQEIFEKMRVQAKFVCEKLEATNICANKISQLTFDLASLFRSSVDHLVTISQLEHDQDPEINLVIANTTTVIQTLVTPAYAKQSVKNRNEFVSDIQEQIMLLSTLQNVIKNRNKLLLDYQKSLSEAANCSNQVTEQQSKLNVNKAPSASTFSSFFQFEDPQTKINKLKIKLAQCEQETTSKRLQLLELADLLKEEMEKFKIWRKEDTKKMLADFAISQVEFHSKAKRAWKTILHGVESGTDLQGLITQDSVNISQTREQLKYSQEFNNNNNNNDNLNSNVNTNSIIVKNNENSDSNKLINIDINNTNNNEILQNEKSTFVVINAISPVLEVSEMKEKHNNLENNQILQLNQNLDNNSNIYVNNNHISNNTDNNFNQNTNNESIDFKEIEDLITITPFNEDNNQNSNENDDIVDDNYLSSKTDKNTTINSL